MASSGCLNKWQKDSFCNPGKQVRVMPSALTVQPKNQQPDGHRCWHLPIGKLSLLNCTRDCYVAHTTCVHTRLQG